MLKTWTLWANTGVGAVEEEASSPSLSLRSAVRMIVSSDEAWDITTPLLALC